MRRHRDMYEWAGVAVFAWWLVILFMIIATATGLIDLPEVGTTNNDYDPSWPTPYWPNTPIAPPPMPDHNPFTPF